MMKFLLFVAGSIELSNLNLNEFVSDFLQVFEFYQFVKNTIV